MGKTILYFTTLLLASTIDVDSQESKGTHAHTHHTSGDHVHATTVKATIVKTTAQADGQEVLLKLTRLKDDQPLSPQDLLEVHTEKVHLLIVDESLSDYHHVHPKPTKEPGVYKFTWMPKLKAHYKLWADITPVASKQQEYAVVDLMQESQDKKPVATGESLEANVEGYTFTLTLPAEKIKAGTGGLIKLTIKETTGPVTTLEPLMGAFAHLVGFGDDFNSIAHLHPMGTEPTKDTERGGPDLSFHLEPEKAGIIRLFAQVKIKGKEVFAPFTLIVQP